MVTLISELTVLEIVQKRILLMAMSEGFVSDETLTIDATHVEARNLPLYEKTIAAQLDAVVVNIVVAFS
jgi:transposase